MPPVDLRVAFLQPLVHAFQSVIAGDRRSIPVDDVAAEADQAVSDRVAGVLLDPLPDVAQRALVPSPSS